MARKFKAQIVVMCKEDMASYVREQAAESEETIAGMSRIMLAESKRVREVSRSTGYSVEDLLRQLEKLADAETTHAYDRVEATVAAARQRAGA